MRWHELYQTLSIQKTPGTPGMSLETFLNLTCTPGGVIPLIGEHTKMVAPGEAVVLACPYPLMVKVHLIRPWGSFAYFTCELEGLLPPGMKPGTFKLKWYPHMKVLGDLPFDMFEDGDAPPNELDKWKPLFN